MSLLLRWLGIILSKGKPHKMIFKISWQIGKLNLTMTFTVTQVVESLPEAARIKLPSSFFKPVKPQRKKGAGKIRVLQQTNLSYHSVVTIQLLVNRKKDLFVTIPH